MDNPLIFGYQSSGVKTLCMTQEVEGGAVLDVCALSAGRRRGDPELIEGEVFLNHAAEKSVKGSRLIVRTGIRHR